MASRYLEEIRTAQPRGPYILMGHCIGALIGWEMVRQLRAIGEDVAHLFMLDAPNVSSPRYRPGRHRTIFEEFLRMKKDRRALVMVWLHRALRRPVKPDLRLVLGHRVMLRAARRFKPSPQHVPATAIMTGLADGLYLGLAGSWDDGAMGWTAWTDRGVTIEKVPAEHSELVSKPETAAIVTAVLARLPAR